MQKWLIYDLLLGAAPAILVPIGFWLRNHPKTGEILGDGQLFFFCTALAGTTYGALSEVADKVPETQRGGMKLCYAGLFGLIILATYAFGVAAEADSKAKSRIAYASVWLSVGAAVLIGFMRSYFQLW